MSSTLIAGGRSKALLSWSSGKDCAWALHVLRQRGELEIVGLLTTLNEVHNRVAMHGVRAELLERQAKAARLPLWSVPLPSPCSNEQYEHAMSQVVDRARGEGVSVMAFGDLFLEDVRRYREEKLAPSGVRPIFPLWGVATEVLAREMIAGGLRARISCVDSKVLPASFAGRDFDEAFLRALPRSVDPCGERGEFHSFAYDGPMFDRPVSIQTGEIVERDTFVFADLLLSDGSA